MDTVDIRDNFIGTGEMRDLYFALTGTGVERTLLGWDAVDDNSLSKYQKMLGNVSVDVFVISLKYPGKPIFFWNMQGWETAQEKWKDYLPKEVQMALLTGAL